MKFPTLAACGLASLAMTSTAVAQFEFEPNNSKAQANVISGMTSGSWLSGSSTSATSSGLDYFLISTAPTSPGLYRHELVLTTNGTPGHIGTLRGLSQSGGVIGTTDSVAQTTNVSTSPPRMNVWYGFGRGEQLYYRVVGTSATTQPYYATLTTTQVSNLFVPGSFAAGQFTFTTVGQGHSSDTDMWLYDANLNAIALAGNDDEYGGATFGSTLTRNLGSGTYYLALSSFNFANEQASPPDDDYQIGVVLDFADAATCSTLSTALNLGFSISDVSNTVPVSASSYAPGEIVWVQFHVSGAPLNDYCANAIAIGPGTVAGTTVDATNDQSSSCASYPADVWYSYSAGATPGTLSLNTCGSGTDPVVSVFSSCGGSEIACNDDCTGNPCGNLDSCLSVSLAANQTVSIRVAHYSTPGTFVLNASFNVSGTPANDLCANAIFVAVPSITSGTTVNTTIDAGLPLCDGPGVADVGGNNTNSAGSVWYRVIGNGQTIYADTLTNSYDTRLTVYAGACGSLACVTVNDDVAGSYRSKVAWASVAGQQYFVMVHGYSSLVGTFTLNLTSSPTPPNDNCAEATAINGLSGSINGTNVGATGAPSTITSDMLATCASSFTYWDTWFTWTPSCSGSATLSTCGAFDTLLSVHSVCPTLSAGNQIGGACNNDGAGGCAPGSQLTFPVSLGVTYLIRVATDGDHAADPGGGAAYSLSWSLIGTDGDGDGTPDCIDGCPSDANKTSPGLCGCGFVDSYGCAQPTPRLRISEQRPVCVGQVPTSFEECVALANGGVEIAVVDCAVPSRGFPFVWKRTYNSRADYLGPLGRGWTSTYDRCITVTGGGHAALADGRGREDLYTSLGGSAFAAPAGIFATLVHNANGTWTQRMPDGTIYEYDAGGYLVSIRDRAGNQLTLTRNAFHNVTQIIDTQGRIYNVAYTGTGSGQRVASLTDFAGRQWLHTYESDGDLIAVRSPIVVGTPNGNDFPLGKTTLYTYSFGFADERLNHNLLSIVDPAFNVGDDPSQSKASRTFTYAATTNPQHLLFDRVVSERVGHNLGGPPSNPATIVGGTLSFAITDTLSGDSSAPAGAVRRTTVSDANGNIGVHYFDANGRELKHIQRTNREVRPGEVDYSTLFTFDSEGRLIAVLQPRGNEIRFAFDASNPQRLSQGNLLELRRVPFGAAYLGIVTRFTYEPIYNQCLSVTTPQAFQGGTVPLDGNGHLDLDHPQVARFTTMHFFDYQEITGVQAAAGVPVSERIPAGLGDLNGAPDFAEGNLVQVRLPIIQSGPNSGDEGIATRTWNALGQLLTDTDPEGSLTAYEYFPSLDVPNDPSDREGYLRSETRDFGGASHFNLRTEFGYDTAGNVTTAIDPKGNVSSFSVNALNQVVEQLSRTVAGSLRYRTWNFFDANDNLVRVERDNRDEYGNPYPHATIVDRYEFDILRNLVVQALDRTRDDGTLAGEAVCEFRYDANGNCIAERSPVAVNGAQPANVLTRLFDERDLVFRSVRGDNDLNPANAPPSTAAVESKTYNENGYLFERVDGVRNALATNAPSPSFLAQWNGDVWQFVYDDFDRLQTTYDPEGSLEGVSRDLAGDVFTRDFTGRATAGGPLTTLEHVVANFDEQSRQFATFEFHFECATGFVVDDGFSTQTTNYDLEGKLLSTTDDLGRVTTHTWDLCDRLVKTTDPLGNEVELAYDANSNLISRIQRDVSTNIVPATYTTTYAYDGLDRRIRTVDSGGNVLESFYDSRGNVVRSSDANRGSAHPGGPGNTTTYAYDALDRLVRTERHVTSNGLGDGTDLPLERIVTLEWWDDNSRRSAHTDDRGNTTTYAYDALDRLITTSRCDATIRSYQYDRDGHRTGAVDPNQSSQTYVYDGLDRLVQTLVVRGAGVIGATYETYAYDGLSRLVRAQNDDGLVAQPWAFTFEFDSLGNPTVESGPTGTLSSAHDGASNRTQVVRPSGRTYDYVYDALDRLVRVSEPSQPPIVEFHYEGGGQREWQREFGNGTRTDYVYDGLPRLIRSHTTAPGGATLLDFEYGHDRMSQPLFERRAHDSNRGQVYQYDSVSRVVRQLLDTALGGLSGGQSIDPSAYSSSHEQSFRYDGNSNRTLELDLDDGHFAQTVYESDCADVYTSVAGDFEPWGATAVLDRARDANGNTTADGAFRYEYDFRDRLVRVRERATDAPVVEYSYDALDRLVRRLGYGPSSETLFAHAGEQVVEEYNGALQLTREYLWGLDDDDLVQERTPAATWYAHSDASDNVVALSGSAGAVVERYDFDSSGRAQVILDGATGNPYRYAGLRVDPQTDLDLRGGKAYDPSIGRSLQHGSIAGDALACVGFGLGPKWGPRPPLPTIALMQDPPGVKPPTCPPPPDPWPRPKPRELIHVARFDWDGEWARSRAIDPDPNGKKCGQYWQWMEQYGGLGRPGKPLIHMPTVDWDKLRSQTVPVEILPLELRSITSEPSNGWFDPLPFGPFGSFGFQDAPRSGGCLPQDPLPPRASCGGGLFDSTIYVQPLFVFVHRAELDSGVPPVAPEFVVAQDPPPPVVSQEDRERMVRDLIKKVRDNFPGDRTGNLIIQQLRNMLADNEVTDAEMARAREIVENMF